MDENKEVMRLGYSPGVAEKSSWAVSIVLGVLIAAASFTLVFSAVAWFMPKFLWFTQTRWAGLLPLISALFISTSGLVRYLRMRRTRKRPSSSAADVR